MQTQLFRVPDMHCANCVMRLEGIEDELDGVQAVRASYRKQQMEVEYDETRVTTDQIIAVAKQVGYTATAIQPLG